ncbi:IQ motif-containing protein H [Silurus meridionalis]|uniref:IQ motif-containing protein H n=1 Tax=Silurus meridionalis TaxID=175797 RepID=UPI001EEAA279|nr:IQ motif-containing protein H [Silurus meridionalis]XP_046721052.1 IQ motif-containing protein H [Silurus meridionalis]
MADIIQKGDELGRILVQVQNDLTELRKSLGRTHHDGTVDVQALDSAIRRTEHGIKSHTEEFLKIANNQVLTLPIIEHTEKKTRKIAKWQPPTESIPYIHPRKHLTAGASPGEKHKAASTLRVLYNPDHPKHRELMQQNYGIQLPDLFKKPGPNVGTQKITSSTVSVVCIDQNRTLIPAYPLCEQDKKAGLGSHLGECLLPSAAKHSLVKSLLMPQCQSEDSSHYKMGKQQRDTRQIKDNTSKTISPEYPSIWTTLTPPPTAASSSRLLSPGPAGFMPLNSQCALALPAAPSSQHFFSIVEGRIDPSAADFCAFKEHYCLSWSTLQAALWQLERLLCQFAVPHALVCGDRLVALALRAELWWGRAECLLSALENRDEVLEFMQQPGQRYKGEGGRRAAAVRIQACWRCYRTRTVYLHQQRCKWAARTIAVSWLLHARMSRVRKSLQATRLRQMENFHSRAKHLANNWEHLITSKRTIIHLPSLGYSEQQRHSLKSFDILQNTQMGRLCDIRDKNVEVIYVCPVHLGEDLIHYYTHLLALNGTAETGNPTPSIAKSFTILTPEAHQHFSGHCMCVSTLLKYSPHTLRRIKNLIQGKQAYLVSAVPHMDDLAVADELGVPVLGPEPAVAQLYGTKSGIRRIFSSSGVSMPPGQADIYTLQQLHECFAQLMTDHLEVQRWLFKIDDEFGGRGTAYCDVCHVSFRPWALEECNRHGAQMWRMAWAQERVLRKYLEVVPVLLATHAKPCDTSCYPTWSCFLEHLLKKGGVIEAYPPINSVTCMSVDLLVEPGGGVRMLSCGDQLHGPGFLQVAGFTVPQSSVCPDVLYSICMRIGKACQERHILGHFSLDLVTFLEPGTLEKQVWAVDLDLGYSNQLAMTQIMLHMTGGTLNCHASRLEVPSPVRNSKPAARQRARASDSSAPASSHFAVMSSRLFHTNLSMVHYSVFFQMCKAHGIGFDIKAREGSVFALHDSAERSSLGMVTISPDLQGALLTFACNLTVIHQEISASNMQGETNFKELIKNIKQVLNVITQNRDKKPKENEKSADV